jgi:hypothetical protein
VAAHVALYTRPAAPHRHRSDWHQRNSTRPQGLRCWPNIYTVQEGPKRPAKIPSSATSIAPLLNVYMMLTDAGLAIQKFRVDGRDHLYICTLLYNTRDLSPGKMHPGHDGQVLKCPVI